jgi:hypothetical protein
MKRLVRLLRRRYPEVFVQMRGRERRWYDMSEEHDFVTMRGDARRRLQTVLASLCATDQDLAAAFNRVVVAEQSLRRALWLGVALTVTIILCLSIAYNLSK